MYWLSKYFMSVEQQRLHLLNRAPEGPLKDYLSVPFPDKCRPITELEILSLDFETTGLNAVFDQLLSIGFVNINRGKIELNSCYHQVIKTKGKLKKSNVAVHQITDFEKDRGAELKAAVDQLLRAMAGKVLLVHFAQIERHFLTQACFEIYGVKPPFIMIDTLAIAKRRFDLSDTPYDPSKLRLTNLRDMYELPGYYAHNALNDAIATGELLLAELFHHYQGLHTKLGDLL